MEKVQVGRGAVLGALAGDAAGATLEFASRRLDRQRVREAMEMVGGGILRTAPGQITDDGEMALCLMHALAGETSFPIERVAVEYLRWHRSRPFDIGATTSTGLSGGEGRPAGMIHHGMWHAAVLHNRSSKANGGLMRIAPLGAWGWRISEAELVEAACRDSRLTHSHPTCQHAAALYCLAIRHLMHQPGDSEGAFRAAEEWAEKLGSQEVRDWLSRAARNEDAGYSPHIGFVRYGFSHAFRHLKNQTPYPEAIFETLAGGGDTDTNACIVGGLAGALHGEEAIPAHMREAIYSCDTRRGRPRPEFLQTRVQLPALLERLIA